MTIGAENPESKPSTSAFATLLRVAKPGQTISIHLVSRTAANVGTLREILCDGLVLEAETGIEWIPAGEIHAWRLPKQEETIASPSPVEVTSPNSPDTQPEAPVPITATRMAASAMGDTTASRVPAVPSPSELELLFAGDPLIVLQTPSFDFPSLDKGIQQSISRWQNRYEYAQKVREPARTAQDVPKILELADALSEPGLYLLAGLLAYSSGLGPVRARDCFERALNADQNCHQAALALAILAIDAKEWTAAIKLLLWALRGGGPDEKTSLIRLLGQCVLRLDGSTATPPIGVLLSFDLSDSARRFATSLVALAVQSDTAAYTAALSGDVEGLRQTRIGNDLFPWHDQLEAPITKRQAVPTPSAPTVRDGPRQGRVSAYYPNRNFGFIVEDSTGQTWFFHKTAIVSPALVSSVSDGRVRQDVTFSGSVEVQSGKYPLATEVAGLSEESAVQVDTTTRAPLRLRLQAIPKDGSSFAKAMEAEQLDQLERAEILYKEEISKRGLHIKSAIKNLSNLTSRRGKPHTAIEILEKYRSEFDETDSLSLNRLRVHFLVKGRRFVDAAQLLSQLAKATADKSKSIEYTRQAAYCLLTSGSFDASITLLNTILKTRPNDNATLLLLAKAKEAKQTGVAPAEFAASEDEHDELLSSLALGLSTIARDRLDTCDFRGTDERPRETGAFSERDIRQVEQLLERLRGRRPRERADYLLTLAALCERMPESAADRSLHTYLRRFFVSLAETAMSEHSPVDVVRCYTTEALALCPVTLSKGAEVSIETAFVLLIATYCREPLDPGVLLNSEPGQRLRDLLVRFTGSSGQEDWKRFIDDTPFYRRRAPSAFDYLVPRIHEVRRLREIPSVDGDAVSRMEEVNSTFATLVFESLSADRLRHARERLAQQSANLFFELDRGRLGELLRLLSTAAEYALKRHFRERETLFLMLGRDIGSLTEEMYRFPTQLSIEKILPCLTALRDLLQQDFNRVETGKPTLEVRNVLDNDFYVVNDGAVALRLLLTFWDESAPPIEAIGLVLEQGAGEPCHSPEPLQGGQSREIELTVKPSAKQIGDRTFTVNVIVEYRTRKGSIERSRPYPIAVRLESSAFDEIANPYGRYSGGSPVEEESMFFGRVALLDRISEYLSTGPMGQCFVLYGQKRSGKSSVLKQVEQRLAAPVLFASVSAGTFSPGTLWGSFARLLIQELTFRLEDACEALPERWPSPGDIDASPLEAIRDVARTLAKRGHKIIVAIDEFTYIFENASEDMESFMRGWKALLEAKTFNALLIGQDTMPRFKQAFSNEFGVTHDERITYLTEEEAADLASQPILLDGASRYRGQALHRLFDLTAGSPYFLQIACDRLVRHLNARKAAFVTEADIDQVARTLTLSVDALPPERFDALVTAAGEKVAFVPKDDLWRVLARIARESLHSGWCYRTALSELPRSAEALKDLSDREILASDGERVSIRVGLFAAWLRANQ
jgi:tetratricopeptide (TPR) repeat protein